MHLWKMTLRTLGEPEDGPEKRPDSLDPPETFWGLLGPPGPPPGASWGFLGSPGTSCSLLSSGDRRPAAHGSARGPGPGPLQHAPQRSTHGQLTVNTTVNTRSTQRSTSLKINELLRACWKIAAGGFNS